MLVNKNTVLLEKPVGNMWYIRIPRWYPFGICLLWKTVFKGTREECMAFAEKKYNVNWKRYYIL